MVNNLSTIPHLVVDNGKKYPDQVAMREKSLAFGKLKIGIKLLKKSKQLQYL